MPGPTIGENRVDVVAADNFAEHLRHEFEIARTRVHSSASDRASPCAAPFARWRRRPPTPDGPVAASSRMQCGSTRDHRHVQLAATADQIAQACLYRQATRCDDEMARRSDKTSAHATGRNAGPVGMDAVEEIEPPIGIKRGRIFFHESQLDPTHGLGQRVGDRLQTPPPPTLAAPAKQPPRRPPLGFRGAKPTVMNRA